MTFEKSLFIGSFRIRIHFLSVLSAICLILAQSAAYSFIVLLCAAFHELGHISAAKLCGAKIYELAFLPFGAELKIAGKISYSGEILIYICGPLFNLLMGTAFFAAFALFPNPLLLFGGLCSLFLMLINLVPVCGFDGGNIVRCFLLSRKGTDYHKATRAAELSELISLILLSLIAVHTVIFCRFNISVAAICIYLFFATALRRQSV